MNHGKELCKKLKEIRKAVAVANDIEYNPTECHHKGRCPGTCAVCDAEVEAINKALARKVAMGEDVVIPNLDIEDFNLSGINPHPTNPLAGMTRTPDEIKRIYKEYGIPYDNGNDEDDDEHTLLLTTLLGDIVSPMKDGHDVIEDYIDKE